MRYLKQELYEKLSNGKKEDEDNWLKVNRAYIEAFKFIRKKLPKSFVDFYENNYGFHDAKILEININFDSRETSMQIIMDDVGYYNKKCEVLLERLQNFEVNFLELGATNEGIKEFNYSELLLSDKKTFIWEIDLFSSTMKLEFKKIKLRELVSKEF